MNRRYDWASQMYSVIDAHIDSPFEWGLNDCCLFAARVVDAMCGTAHEVELTKHYSDEASALQYIENFGGIAKAVETYLGKSLTDGRPNRGDVILFSGENGETIGVCCGLYIAAMGAEGIVTTNRSTVICYWSI